MKHILNARKFAVERLNLLLAQPPEGRLSKEEIHLLLVDAVAVKNPKALHRMLCQKSQFTPYQYTVAEAFEMCELMQGVSDKKRDAIVAEVAASIFNDPAYSHVFLDERKDLAAFIESICRAWIDRTYTAVNDIRRIRRKLKLLLPV